VISWWGNLDQKQKLSLGAVWLLAAFFVWRSLLPFMAELNYRNAFYYDNGKNYKEAAKYFNKAVNYYPLETYYRVQLGGVYEKLADTQEKPDDKMHYLKLAELQYEECLLITDRNPWYHNRLGSIYLKYEVMAVDEAEKARWRKMHREKIIKASQLDPNNGIFQLQAGYMYFQKGQYEIAEKMLMHIINDIDENMVDPYLIMADIYRVTNRKEQTKEILEKIVALDPRKEHRKMERVYIQLGNIYEIEKNYQAATNQYIAALKVNRNSSTAANLLKRAAYYAKDKNRLKLAAKLLAIKFEPNRVDNYLLYFQVADRTEDKEEITKILKIAKSKFPNNEKIRQFATYFLK